MARQAAKVYIYRNLGHVHPETYSIRYKGRVIGHSDTVWVANPTFTVSEAGRQRVNRESKKYVHAFIVAEPEWVWWPAPYLKLGLYNPEWLKVVYNPYKHRSFMLEEADLPLFDADVAALTPQGVYVLSR